MGALLGVPGAILEPSWAFLGHLGPIWSNPEASAARCQRKRENAYTAEWRDAVVRFCLLGGLLERFRGDLHQFSGGLLPLAGMMGSILSHLGLCCVILQVFVASQAIAEPSRGKFGRSNASRLNRQNTVFATESGLTSWGDLRGPRQGKNIEFYPLVNSAGGFTKVALLRYIRVFGENFLVY